jgi:hypothetical protein
MCVCPDFSHAGVRVELVMKLLGLYHARNTLVGDPINRGISGGEKKRLTTSEQVRPPSLVFLYQVVASASVSLILPLACLQIVGPRNVLMLDEISTGLDSATLFVVIRWLTKVRAGEPDSFMRGSPSLDAEPCVGAAALLPKLLLLHCRTTLQWCHASKTTTVVSLLQPPPEVYQVRYSAFCPSLYRTLETLTLHFHHHVCAAL